MTTDKKSDSGTSKPGRKVDAVDAKIIIGKMVEAFRPKNLQYSNSNVPTACLIEGVDLTLDKVGSQFGNGRDVLAYFENTNELFQVFLGEFISYFTEKEPWEDYDICLFDRSFSWCVALTHEEIVKLVINK
jgi:hypothetical protein